MTAHEVVPMQAEQIGDGLALAVIDYPGGRYAWDSGRITT